MKQQSKEKLKKFFLFINNRSLFISVLLFLILIKLQFGQGHLLSLQGKEGIPYFDSRGILNIIYINSTGGISLAEVQEGYIDKISVQNILYADNVNSIRIKKDRTAKVWLAWEEVESGTNHIYVAPLTNKILGNPIKLTQDRPGFHFSPSIDFSFGNELWVAWINYFQKRYRILIKNVTTNQVWDINSPSASSALSPRLTIDGTGKIWLFWVGQLGKRDEILYTFFDGLTWKHPLSLNQNPDAPHMHPSVSLDFNGFPHIVWSAYDGDDYELYYSCWDGNSWNQESLITDNQNISDTHPSLSMLSKTFPAVAWSRYRHEKREVCLSYQIDDEWSPAIIISNEKDMADFPKLVSFEGKIGILWQTETEIKAALVHFYKLEEFFNPDEKKAESFKIQSLDSLRILALDRDKYIGFGDSITYGILHLEEAPEEGYVPRLEKRIDKYIKDSQVINRGLPGEKTSEGLSRIQAVINDDQAQTVFLMEGTNDVKDTEISTDTIAFNLEKMSEICLNLRMTVFLASILPTGRWEGLIKERILELNQEIKSIASQFNIHFVDQFEVFIVDSYKNYKLYSDSSHPNEEGYKLMAKAWFEALVASLPWIEMNTTFLSFEGRIGEANPSPQVFKIRNSGAGTLSYQISDDQDWISVSPASGDSTGESDDIEVSIDISNLPWGTHQGYVTISSDYTPNSPQVVRVDLNIIGPTIEADTTSLSFEGTIGEDNPPAQIFKIRNSGAGLLEYQISADQTWIQISPETGDSRGEWDDIEVSMDISNLSEDSYQGKVMIASDDASNSPQELMVDLTVWLPPLFPPLNFRGEKKTNRSLSQLEYINVLSWEENPQNKFIEKYKIYLIEGENKTLLKELDPQTHEFWHRRVLKDTSYQYELTAKDQFGRESEPVYIEVR